MNLILLGAPGSGKGTQARRLKEILKIVHVCTGDILREAVLKENGLGRKVGRTMAAGALVPDDIIIEVMRHRLKEKDCRNGYLLDGFPRTRAQAEALDLFLQEEGSRIDFVVSLKVEREELIKRMGYRGRDDDQDEIVLRRLKLYEDQTAMLVDHYKKKGKIVEVDGVGPVEEVTKVLLGKLKK